MNLNVHVCVRFFFVAVCIKQKKENTYNYENNVPNMSQILYKQIKYIK